MKAVMNFCLEPDQVDFLKDESKRTGLSISAIVRRMIQMRMGAVRGREAQARKREGEVGL